MQQILLYCRKVTLLDDAAEFVPATAPVPAGVPVPDLAAARFGLADYVGELALLLGAGSAVANQLALVGVGRGVAEHSTTLQRPQDRLRTTLTYVYVMTMGTADERKAVARMVNRVHGPVKGEGYSAFDPDLQLWVAATLSYGGEQMYEKTFGPMDEATRERAYRESWVIGTALQVKEEAWPQTRAEFTAYWERMQSELTPDPVVQLYMKRLLSPSRKQWMLAPAVLVQSLITRGNLTPQVREVLGLRWTRLDQRLYDGFWTVFRATYPRLPKVVRQAYSRSVLRGMRKRMRENRRVI